MNVEPNSLSFSVLKFLNLLNKNNRTRSKISLRRTQICLKSQSPYTVGGGGGGGGGESADQLLMLSLNLMKSQIPFMVGGGGGGGILPTNF